MAASDTSSFSSKDKSSNGSKTSFEDTLISGLETVCSFFDNVYFAKSLGIIGDNNFLYKHLNKGGWGSKLWFVTLLLSVRKCIRQLLQIAKKRSRLTTEIGVMDKDGKGLMSDVLREKISLMLQKSNILMRETLLDLLQNVVYLIIVVIDVFKLKVPKKGRQYLEPLSNFVTILRFFTMGFSTSVSV